MGGSAPKPPSYNQAQAEQSARNAAMMTALLSQYNYVDPYGTVSWTGDVLPKTNEPQAGGSFWQRLKQKFGSNAAQTSGSNYTPRTMQVDLSPMGKKQLSLAESLVEQAGTGYGDEAGKRAEEAVYGQYTSRLEPDFEKQRQATHNKLINQGIPVGSEAYSKTMEELDQAQTDARQQAMQSSVLTGQQSQAQQLQNLINLYSTLGQPKTPQYQPGIGASQFPNLYDQAYNAAMQRYGIMSQNYQGGLGAIGGIASGLAGGLGSSLGKKIFG